MFRAFLLIAGLVLLAPPALARGDVPPEGAVAAEASTAALPAEVRQTIALIRKGGPFPFQRDGVEFRNFENRLPPMPRGYYREYTVRTPGAKDRGARRIVAGRGGELYYTDDHYDSFQRIKEP